MAVGLKKENDDSLTPTQWNNVTERTLSLASEITRLSESSEKEESHPKEFQKEAHA
jgi:hypothetical protein